MKKYYYLIASLPLLEKKSAPDQYGEVVQLINRNLSESDRELFQYLLYPTDIKYLMNQAAEARNLTPVYPHVLQPATIDHEDLLNIKKGKKNSPAFLAEFFEENQKDIDELDLIKIESLVIEKFYKYVFQQNDPFLKDYFTFDRDLKNLLVFANAKNKSFKPFQHLTGEFNTDHSGGKQNLENDIVRKYNLAEELTNMITDTSPVELEKKIDKIRWEYIDELAAQSYFDLHALFAYFLKYQLKHRWEGEWSEEAAQQRLDQLIDHAMESFNLPEALINPKKL